MPPSIRANLSLDDQQFQRGMAQAKAALGNFERASKEASVTAKELDRALNSNAAFGKQLTEVQKQQIAYTAELTAARNRLGLQMAGEGKLAQDLGVKFNLLSNEQRAILQATKEATAAWEADQRALAAQAAATEKAALATAAEAEALAAETTQAKGATVAFAGLGTAMAGLALLGVAAGFKAVLDAGLASTDALNRMQVTTGATGAEFEKLTQSMQNVSRGVPNSLQDVAQAIATVHQRTGLAGPALEKLTTQMLNLSRITGGDLKESLRLSTRTFGDWGIKVRDQGTALDLMFKASQRTGIELDRLQQLIVRYGAPLRQMGFSFIDATALISKFEQEGVNSELVLTSLRIALTRFAKAGVTDAAQALTQLTEQIKNAGSAAEANAIAVKAFGARSGPDMAASIREGRFAIDDLVVSMKNSENAINQAAGRVDTLGTRFAELRKHVAAAVAPLGHELEGALKGLVHLIDTDVVPALQRLVKGWGRSTDAVWGYLAAQRQKFAREDRATEAMVADVMAGGTGAAPTLRPRIPLPPGVQQRLDSTLGGMGGLSADAQRRVNAVAGPVGTYMRGGSPPTLPGVGSYGASIGRLGTAASPATGVEQDLSRLGKTGAAALSPYEQAVKAVKEQIADYTYRIHEANVAVTTQRDNVHSLTAAQRDFLADNRLAPQALRLEALALKEQNDALAANEAARKKAGDALTAANRAANQEVARLKAQIADLAGGTGKEQSILERFAGASPQARAAVQFWLNQLDLATQKAKAVKEANDLLAQRLGKLDSAYQASRLEGLKLAATTDMQRAALDLLGITLDKVPASLLPSLEATVKMEQQTRAAAEAFRLAREQADQYFALFRTGAEAIDAAQLELDKSTATLNLSGDQLAVENMALERFKKHFLELPIPIQAVVMALVGLGRQAAGATANLTKLGVEKDNVFEGKAPPEEVRAGNPATLARQFEDYYQGVIMPLNQAAERAAQQAAEFMGRLADGTQQTFTKVFQDIGEHGFKGLFANIRASFSQMLIGMAADYLGSQVRNLLFGDQQKQQQGINSTGLLGGLLGGLFGGGGGGGVTDASQLVGNISGFAAGGSIRAGQMAWVGERGPELFRPRVAGTITPHGGGGGITQHITIISPDQQSFHRNMPQVQSDMLRAAARINRRNGG